MVISLGDHLFAVFGLDTAGGCLDGASVRSVAGDASTRSVAGVQTEHDVHDGHHIGHRDHVIAVSHIGIVEGKTIGVRVAQYIVGGLHHVDNIDGAIAIS